MVTTYSFQTLDDPADPNTPTFTNLLGINERGLIAGFYGSANPGDPNQGFLLTPSGTFTQVDFPGQLQTQLTGLKRQWHLGRILLPDEQRDTR